MKRIATALAIATALGLTGAASAYDWPAKHAQRVGASLVAAGVDADVAANVQTLSAKEGEARKQTMLKVKAKKLELNAALAAASLDGTKIDALASEIAALKGELFKGHVNFRKEVSALLNAAQREKFFAAMDDKKGKYKHKRMRKAKNND